MYARLFHVANVFNNTQNKEPYITPISSSLILMVGRFLGPAFLTLCAAALIYKQYNKLVDKNNNINKNKKYLSSQEKDEIQALKERERSLEDMEKNLKDVNDRCQYLQRIAEKKLIKRGIDPRSIFTDSSPSQTQSLFDQDNAMENLSDNADENDREIMKYNDRTAEIISATIHIRNDRMAETNKIERALTENSDINNSTTNTKFKR